LKDLHARFHAKRVPLPTLSGHPPDQLAYEASQSGKGTRDLSTGSSESAGAVWCSTLRARSAARIACRKNTSGERTLLAIGARSGSFRRRLWPRESKRLLPLPYDYLLMENEVHLGCCDQHISRIACPCFSLYCPADDESPVTHAFSHESLKAISSKPLR